MRIELLLAPGSGRRVGPAVRTAVAARAVLRAPVGGAQAAASIAATLALVAMWAAQAARLPEPVAVQNGGQHAGDAPYDNAAAAAGDVTFTATGLLAGVVSVGDGPVIPVLGVDPAELRDTFGDPRNGERRHAGIDIGAPRGTPVAAAMDGWIVAFSDGPVGGLGLHLLDRTGAWLLYYSHLDGYRDDVYTGMAVRRGELLGYVGATGNARGWPHLHFEAARVMSARALSAQPVNPYNFLLGR